MKKFVYATTSLALAMLLGASLLAQQSDTSTNSNSAGAEAGTATGAGAAAAGGTGGVTGSADASATATSLDQLFVQMAAIDNQCEIQLSQAAAAQAQDPQVKRFAQRLVQDHQQAAQQLQQLAQKQGAQISADLPELKKQEISAIKSLQGREFDQQYLSAMKCGHLKAVSKFADVAQLSRDPAIKQFAQQMLPTLQQHQSMVLSLAIAQGLPNPMIRMAQPAGATIEPSQPRSGGNVYDRSGIGGARDAGRSRAPGSSSAGTPGGTSGTGAAGASGATPSGTSGTTSGGTDTSGTSAAPGASGTSGGTSGTGSSR